MALGNHPTLVANAHEFQIRGTFGLTAAAAVATSPAPSGDLVPLTGAITKTATGTYQILIPKARLSGFKLVELVSVRANFFGGIPAGALSCFVTSVTNNAAGDLVILIRTADAALAAIDTTAVTRVSYEVIFKYSKRVA